MRDHAEQDLEDNCERTRMNSKTSPRPVSGVQPGWTDMRGAPRGDQRNKRGASRSTHGETVEHREGIGSSEDPAKKNGEARK